MKFAGSAEALPEKDKKPAASLGSALQGVIVTLPDPKKPGKLLCRVQAKSASGQTQETGFLGTMTGVSALLYQHGVPAATLMTPKAQGRSGKKSLVLIASGGVAVTSLTAPGTRLLADTITWYASLNKIVATGHVFFHDGKTGATMTGPRAVADTQMKTIQISSGHVSGLF